MDYRFDVKDYRVIDGDTIEATIDMGFRTMRKDIFRLAGINAPERDKASTAFMVEALEGKDLIIESHKSEKYGRWLATIYADGVNVNQSMLDMGLAVHYAGGKR
jgi:micrococcal nuclease